MRKIITLTDEDFGLVPIPFNNPRTRLGARGIILNSNNDVAILNKQIKNEYKLIGGGIEKDEDPELAFKREALEESGCEIEIIKFLGTIEEHKSQDNFKQKSYVYVAKVIKDTHNLDFTQKEIAEGSKLLWLSINDAMEKIKGCENKLKPSTCESNMSVYHTRFVVRRDYEILKYYLKNK